MSKRARKPASGLPATAANFWPETARPLTAKNLSRYPLVRLKGAPEPFVRIDDQLFPRGPTILSGFTGRSWTGGKLIYKFDASVNEANKLVFITACQTWGEYAKVSCVARTNEPIYVVVASANGNSASVGMPTTGTGVINIFNWNWPYIVAHEIGHSFGLAHEQCRSDRDTFVEILTANISQGNGYNFDKYGTDNVGTNYDFESVMHYSGTALGKLDPNGQPLMTIKVKPPNQNKQAVIGQRTRLSGTDQAGMRARYGAP